MAKILKASWIMPLALFLGALNGYFEPYGFVLFAKTFSEIFINLLKLVSLPIIFLSILSVSTGMESISEMKNLGKKVVKYTLFTTVVAATIAFVTFEIVSPARVGVNVEVPAGEAVSLSTEKYVSYLVAVVPSNILQPFLDNHVVGVLFIAILFSLAIITLPEDNRRSLHTFFSSLYQAVMKITTWILVLMPIAIFSFVTLFVIDLKADMMISSLMLYLFCVVFANLVQALVVLPLLLKAKGISPFRFGYHMMPALSTAFFSKSSSAALPSAMRCARERGGVSAKVAGFSLPLCTTINMNACAAFILTTVLFVSSLHGLQFSFIERALWILIATVAAVGNAGVPMGCYFIAGAFLAALDVPLNILGVILPFYSLLDMLESAINVWSDLSVTAIVDKELKESELVPISQNEMFSPSTHG